MECFCCSKKPFFECCKPLLEGSGVAQTPQMLMRSRYSAYATANGAYLVATATQSDSAQELESFSKSVTWIGLEVLEANGNEVTFKAYYKDASGLHLLHEKSSFVEQEGRWKYDKGEFLSSKIPRNEPCPCGSGKKFKKCCVQP